MSRHLNTDALVIKRVNYGDADRFITLFTLDRGKLSVRARGVRKITSRKRSLLEPLNFVRVSLLESTHGFLLTEAQPIATFDQIRQTLPRLTQAIQLLEILDCLIAENEPHPIIYQNIFDAFYLMNQEGLSREEFITTVKSVLHELGFSYPMDSEASIKTHIEDISQKSLKTKMFLLR